MIKQSVEEPNDFEIKRSEVGFNACIGFVNLTIKSLIISNGGAILALLSNLGNTSNLQIKLSSHFGWTFITFLMFILGLTSVLISSICAYCYQRGQMDL